jgi:hypothetical protein
MIRVADVGPGADAVVVTPTLNGGGTVLFCTWLGAYTAAMPRKLVWIERQKLQGFGCSECN